MTAVTSTYEGRDIPHKEPIKASNWNESKSGRRALRTAKTIFLVPLLTIACIAQFIFDPSAQTSAAKTVTNAENDTNSSKRARSPQNSNRLGIVIGDRDDSELAAANDIMTLIARGQETGPHGEVALRVVPISGGGGFQNIRDLLTLPDADLSIVPAPLLDRAPAALSMDDIRKHIIYISPLFEEEFHLLASSSMRDISELAGKAVNLGVKNSAVDVLGREMFERLGVNVNVVNLDENDAANAMRKGQIEADLVLSSKPVRSLANYTLADGFRLIAIPLLPGVERDFFPVMLTHHDYQNLVPSGVDVDTIGVQSFLIAYNWPKGSVRYSLLDFFVGTLFSAFSELQAGSHRPKWRETNLGATLPGWTQFPTAQRWLDRIELESLLSKRGIDAPADRKRLIQDFLRLRK
jgi:uncharacterized protein